MALDSSIALDYRFIDLSESYNNCNFTNCPWSCYLSTNKKIELNIHHLKNNK
jgi:hypothetical protein